RHTRFDCDWSSDVCSSDLEVVLATAASDAQAPAFGNLFVQTETLDKRHATLCTRCPRAQSDPAPWMFHLMAAHGAAEQPCSYERSEERRVGKECNCRWWPE